jgi:hypothetical protein
MAAKRIEPSRGITSCRTMTPRSSSKLYREMEKEHPLSRILESRVDERFDHSTKATRLD